MPAPTTDLTTKVRQLRTGSSPWAKETASDRPLKRSIKADIVVVGAGVTGALVAEALSRQYPSVVIVDRRSPAAGSTAASTAMLQWEIDTPLVELADKIGAERAQRAWKRSFSAMKNLMRLIESERIRCGLGRRSSLYLTGNEAGYIKLAKEACARRRVGLPSEYIGQGKLNNHFGIKRTGAIVSQHCAVADPVALTRGLLARASRNGARLLFPVEIRDVLATGHGVILDAGEHFIEAQRCVFCTGYELLKGIPQSAINITSTWAIATRPHVRRPKWLDSYVVWEASKPYLYIRTTSDHRLVIGGEDEDIDLATYRRRNLSRKANRLEIKSHRLLGENVRAVRKWTGAFGESKDGLPIIDVVPNMPSCFIAAGLGGNGTIYAMIAAQILSSILRGKSDKDAALYRFR